MKISLCTITFRHHLVSLGELACWAQANRFDGIELWGAHGRNLSGPSGRDADWLSSFGLYVPMVSDYVPLEGDAEVLRARMVALCGLARHWRAAKVRIFAGSRGSRDTPPEARCIMTRRLRELATIADGSGLDLLAETHPGTLADGGASALRLVHEVDHPAFKLNFDTLHVWEGGDDPIAAHAAMRPHIGHYHLKNVRSRADLRVFAPANVYAAAGSREGMTPLFEGKVDYVSFLEELADNPTAEASLEWFGNDCFEVLRKDLLAVRQIKSRTAALSRTGS